MAAALSPATHRRFTGPGMPGYIPSMNQHVGFERLTGVLWAGIAGVLFFNLAGRITTLGWNVAEFVIANNLGEYGRYAFGAFQPTALWRPVLGTLMVFLAERFSSDPMLSYCIVASATLAAFTWSMYYCGLKIGGYIVGNIAAILTITTPAIGDVLLNNGISLSHLAMLGVMGPAAALSLSLFSDGRAAGLRFAAAGLLWGLCVLARPDTIFTAAVFFLTIGFILWRQKMLPVTLIAIVTFCAVWLPSTIWSSSEASKYHLLSGRFIYQFYASQGYSIPPPQFTGDLEHAGYAYAVKLYGTPEENRESVVRAIARNPAALFARVGFNATRMYFLLSNRNLLSLPTLVLLLLAPLGFVLALARRRRSQVATFLWASASAATTAYLLVLHIDARYTLIGLPFALILASYTIAQIGEIITNGRLRRSLEIAVLAAVAVWAPGAWSAISGTHPATGVDLRPLAELSRQFIEIARPTPDERAKMAVLFSSDFPRNTYHHEDMYTLPYFDKLNLVIGFNSASSYPVDRLFSFTNCEPTHGIVRPAVAVEMRAPVIGEINAPVVGKYAVVKLGGKGCAG